MKIMQILPKMDIGGVERGVLDLAKYFKEKEDQIIIVSGGGRLQKDLKVFKAKHCKLNVYKKSLTSLFLIKKIRKIIEKENVDIVHARSRVPAWISFFATRGTNADFITTAHGFYSVHFLSRVMGWGKFVICPSGVIARHMKDRFGVGDDKIIVIDRWVDLDKFKFIPYAQRASKLSVLSVGRISPSKGYEYIIEAMRRIVRTNPYVNLSIVGSCDQSKLKYLNYLKSLVNRYSLSYNIKFLGYRKDIEKLLVQSRILVVPSVVEESFGRVVIEAFACGIPVVAAKIGAIAEIIKDRKDGILVPPKDHQALSRAILELLDNYSLAEDITTEARRKVEEKYSLSKCISKVEEAYNKTKEIKRIMVIKISSLGDLILAIPSFKALRDNFHKSQITLLTLKKYVSLFYDCPYIDKVIGLDANYKNIRHILEVGQELRKRSFDYIVDLQNSKSSHLITFLSFPRKSFGFSRKFSFLLFATAKFPAKEPVDPLTSQERILKLLGVTFKEKKLTFWDTKSYDISSFGLGGKKLIGINVSASPKWLTKNWPTDNIRKLMEIIYKELRGYNVVFIGDEKARARAEEIGRSFKRGVINLCGKTTFRDLIEVLKRMKVFITPDTATLHLAQSLGINTIALFGPTDPSAHTVRSNNLHIIFKEMDCSFCYKSRCGRHECMVKITPSEVFSKLKSML